MKKLQVQGNMKKAAGSFGHIDGAEALIRMPSHLMFDGGKGLKKR